MNNCGLTAYSSNTVSTLRTGASSWPISLFQEVSPKTTGKTARHLGTYVPVINPHIAVTAFRSMIDDCYSQPVVAAEQNYTRDDLTCFLPGKYWTLLEDEQEQENVLASGILTKIMMVKMKSENLCDMGTENMKGKYRIWNLDQ
ncbi:hypothetical protein J6590_019068 [Homalodisca vitripennis]|nr:hypothetical protein J6590_019068 [Homalodisca vitripennis]